MRGAVSLQFYKLVYPNLHVGKKSKIWGKFYLTMYDPLTGRIVIGDNFHMVSEEKRAGLTVYARSKMSVYQNASIIIGKNVWITGIAIACKKRIEIGDNTIIAPNVVIIDSDFHVHWPVEERLSSPTTAYDKEIRIGKNVWIGTNVIILKGASIGDNSIIGAGSVVANEIPKNVFAGGNPARVMKRLNDH